MVTRGFFHISIRPAFDAEWTNVVSIYHETGIIFTPGEQKFMKKTDHESTIFYFYRAPHSGSFLGLLDAGHQQQPYTASTNDVKHGKQQYVQQSSSGGEMRGWETRFDRQLSTAM